MLHQIKKHPFALSAYFIYVLLWLNLLRMGYIAEYKISPADVKLSYGEGVAFMFFFLLIITAIFNVAILLLAVFKKKDRDFYFKLIIASLLPAAMVYALGI